MERSLLNEEKDYRIVKKLSIPDFLSTLETGNHRRIDALWSSHYKDVMRHSLNDEAMSRHKGECTGHQEQCMLCWLENVLRQYKTYYFRNNKIKKPRRDSVNGRNKGFVVLSK